jgi:hypothetical protein
MKPLILSFFALFCACSPSENLDDLTPCTETISVDFEPAPFGDLVQTLPYHIEKEPINNAFVSVKFASHQLPWKIWFSSTNVQFSEPPVCNFDDYDGAIELLVSQELDKSILEVQIWDTTQFATNLSDYQQLIAEIEIQCYNP